MKNTTIFLVCLLAFFSIIVYNFKHIKMIETMRGGGGGGLGRGFGGGLGRGFGGGPLVSRGFGRGQTYNTTSYPSGTNGYYFFPFLSRIRQRLFL